MALYPGERDSLPSVGVVLALAAGFFGLLWLLPQPNAEEDADA